MGEFGHRSLRVYVATLDVYAMALRIAKSGERPLGWLENQLIRAVGSIALNIAEGVAEYSYGDKARFYRIARRSAAEAGAALDLLERGGQLRGEECQVAGQRLEAIAAMLTVMIHKARGKQAPKSDNAPTSIGTPESRPASGARVTDTRRTRAVKPETSPRTQPQ